ncbi:MAG: cytochrome c biogenesis protein CcsA [Deltaproteobacteria bacterium]|nr:cytochrome c biogenesis protein CcsA [Deltaproteobacteria bacterium]
MSDKLAYLIFLLHLASLCGFLLAVFYQRPRLAKLAMKIMLAGLLTQAATFTLYHWEGISSATFNAREFSLVLSMFIGTLFLVFQLFTKTRLLGVLVAPVVFSLSAVTVMARDDSFAVIASGGYIALHIALTVVGEAFFIVAVLAGALFLIQENLIRKKRAVRFVRLLPPLDDLDRINHISFISGFPLLTAGIVIGAFMVYLGGNTSLLYDIKGLWTALAWVFYAGILFLRVVLGWRGRKVALLSLGALLLLLFLFLASMNSPHSWHRLI